MTPDPEPKDQSVLIAGLVTLALFYIVMLAYWYTP